MLDRIAVNIAQFLHKLQIISNVEVVVPLFPEMLAPRYALLQRLQRIGQRIPLRFAEQEVDMLRHDYVPVNMKLEAAPVRAPRLTRRFGS